MVADPLLAGLDEYQRAAVTSTAEPLAILAPAGSGKTRVLTRRIAWRARERSLDARHVLAVTFTRKAAGELAQRLRRLGVDTDVTAGTFHTLALAQLRRRAEEAGREPPRVLDRKARVLGRLIDVRGAEAKALLPAVASEIEWAKARMITPERFAEAALRSRRTLPRTPTELAEIYDRYEREKRRRRVVDFEDLLWWCAHAIDTDPTFADAQRWRFRHLFVDEFQDANPLSVRLVAAWLGDRRDLCVVGDVAQAIYGFAGADPTFLDEFERHFPGGERIRLQYNYRSTPQVVRAATAVLGDAPGERVTWARRDDGPLPRLRACTDDEGEAREIATVLRDANQRGVAWSDMAVLFRTNAQSATFERALNAADIPFTVATRSRFLDQPEVQALVATLERTEKAAPRRRLADHLADLVAGTGGDDDGTRHDPTEEDQAYADALANFGREYLRTEGGDGTLGGFLAWLDVATRGETTGTTGRGVELCTFHRGKGLEWSLVCVAGLEAGLVPISYATDEAAIAEERRLLHVALSRAHDELHLSWAQQRTIAGRLSRREPSPLLDAVMSASSPGPADRIPDPRVALGDTRRVLEAARPPQPRVRGGRTRG